MDKPDKKNSILIVDDEYANIMVLTHILRPDYTVHAEKSGQDAIETARRLLPDIILLDIVMPDVDGYSVLRALKADEELCDIPVIFITGLSGIDNEEKGLALGAADYIIKPFVPEVVKLRIANHIKLIENMKLLMEKELEEKSNQAKMNFYLDMSHDMLTPMNVIIGMAQIAGRSKSQDEVKECLEEIENSSKQLLDLILKLLNVEDK